VTKTLANELGSWGVTVNVLQPGRTRTTVTDEAPAPATNGVGGVVDAVGAAWLVAVRASPRGSAVNGEVIAGEALRAGRPPTQYASSRLG
jgi:NAD(P)-dependent dehydrogenase (short-subunit alcohol dehydrogenase family)